MTVSKTAPGTEHLPGSSLVYSCANNGYEDLAVLLIASAMWCGHEAEIGVPDRSLYLAENQAVFDVLSELYRDRYSITQVEFPEHLKPHIIRFLTTPQRRADYVYICDSDLILLDRDFPVEHLKFMNEYGLPYANSLRPGTMRLTGLHFAQWESYYPIPDLTGLELIGVDEVVLGGIVSRKGLPLHSDPWFRPVPGIHPSPNREVKRTYLENGQYVPGWGVDPWREVWRDFRSSDLMCQLVPHLNARAAEVVAEIDQFQIK